MSLLGGRKIKKAYLHRYVSDIMPLDPIDENGIERPEKKLRYFILLDQNNFAYLVPGFYDKVTENWLKAYEPEDVVDAAAGDVLKQDKIKKIHHNLRLEYFHDKLFTEDWIQKYYDGTKQIFYSQYCEVLKRRGLPNVSIEHLPTKAKTIENFTLEEIKNVVDNAIFVPQMTSNGGRERF